MFVGKMLFTAALVCVSVSAYADVDRDSLQQVQDSVGVVEDVVVPPEYEGGMEGFYNYILTNFQYPDECRKRAISGTVEVSFTVERSGDITGVGVIKGLESNIDEELERILRVMPNWKPATRNGDPARYKVTMPIALKVSRANKNGFR